MAYLLKKAGLAFDEKKAGSALKKSSLRLVTLVESKIYNVKMKKAKVRDELESGLLQQAHIDVEQVIRDDVMIKAYDALRQECNFLADKLPMVASCKECPYELEQAVCTIMWAADRVDAPELLTVKTMLQKKFGKGLRQKTELIEGGCVNQKVADKLSFQHINPPSALVEEYLESIAKAANVDYPPRSRKHPSSSSKNNNAYTKTATATGAAAAS